MNFLIREAVESDRRFIIASWLNGHYFSNWCYTEIKRYVFDRENKSKIESIINKPSCKVLMACLSDDTDVILGFSVTEGDVLHWIYVKESWRKMGIGKALIINKINICTHITSIGRFLKKKYNIEYNPYLTEVKNEN